MEAIPQVLLRPLCPASLAAEVKDKFGELIATCINPGAGERDRTATPFSRELLREAGRLGLTGFTLPREIGGQGRSWREWGMVLHEIGYLCEDTAFPMLLAYLGTLTKLLHQTGRRDLADRYVVGTCYVCQYPEARGDECPRCGTWIDPLKMSPVFCKICGTRLFAWRRKPAVAGVALAAFDDRNAFAPTDHMWITEKMDWVRIDDGLPQYPGTAP